MARSATTTRTDSRLRPVTPARWRRGRGVQRVLAVPIPLDAHAGSRHQLHPGRDATLSRTGHPPPPVPPDIALQGTCCMTPCHGRQPMHSPRQPAPSPAPPPHCGARITHLERHPPRSMPSNGGCRARTSWEIRSAGGESHAARRCWWRAAGFHRERNLSASSTVSTGFPDACRTLRQPRRGATGAWSRVSPV